MPVPFDINQASFLDVLEACHARLLQIQKEDEKRHMMDVDIPHEWVGHLEETILPALESVIYDEPTDEEINAPLHA